MSNSKVFPPDFCFTSPPYCPTSTPLSLPGNEKFIFSPGVNGRSSERRRHFKRPPVASGHSKSAPSSSSSSSSSFTFTPFFVPEKTKEKEDSKETTHENGMPENTKTGSTVLSAVTGTIPCHFEGSSYSSEPLAPTSFATGTEKSTKTVEQSVQNPAASQIIVSRLLKNIPQSPHFWPLRAYSEAAKRSLINAWDQIFEETVDRIQSVQVKGFRVDVKRLWETTLELQMMGYNVIPLRRRLVELSGVMERIEKHKYDKMRLNRKAEQHMMEKNRLEFEIVKLKAMAEAEKASFEDVMANVSKMDAEMPHFNALFGELTIKPL